MDSHDKESKQIRKNRHFSEAGHYALNGLWTAIKEERNLRFQLCMGFLVVVAGLACKVSRVEWLWLALAIGLVLLAEMLNTIAENLVDMITNYTFHPLGKKVKDMAAGAVLLTACLASVIGLVIFVPKIWQLFV